MNRNSALKILTPLLAVLIIFQALSGLLLAVFPYQVHQTTGIILLCGIGLHLILNWPWIRNSFFKR